MITLEVGNSYVKIGPFWLFLTALFAGLKLYGVITWSWWWVLAPTWGPISVIIAVAVYLYIKNGKG